MSSLKFTLLLSFCAGFFLTQAQNKTLPAKAIEIDVDLQLQQLPNVLLSNALKQLDSLSNIELNGKEKFDVYLRFYSVNIDTIMIKNIKKYKLYSLTLDFENCNFIQNSISYINNMSNLYGLDFENCKIGAWKSGISSCINLVEFQLHSSDISVLPSDLGALPKLKSLFILGKLDSLPDVSGLVSLKELKIYTSNIVSNSYPHGICNLNKLENMEAGWQSKDSVLPECIGHLDSISSIYLYDFYPPNSVFTNNNIKLIYINAYNGKKTKSIVDKFNEVDREITLCFRIKNANDFDKRWVKSKKIKICED
jgi:hypothetical protein